MKTLYLMRHGHAPTPAEAGVRSDALRPLSDRGRRDAVRMAEELVKRGARPAMILHSPLVRAVQTAQAAAGVLKTEAAAFQPLDNTLSSEEALAAIKARAGLSQEILAIGHQPQIGEIAAQLSEAVLEIRPAGLVALQLEPHPRLLWALNADEL